MSDTRKQLNLDGNDSFESALLVRLLKRAAEPLGVIDVRYAEEKYLRIVRWLGRCTALLDHLSRRYGVEQARPDGDHPFAIHPRDGQVNVSNTIQTFLSAGLSANLSPGAWPGAEARSNTSQSSQQETQETQQETWRDMRPSGLADILAERSTNPAVKPSSSSEGTFRISRRPAPRMPESEAPLVSRRASTPMEETEGDLVADRSAPITRQMPFRNSVNKEENANVARTTSARKPDGPQVTPATGNDRDPATPSIVQREAPAGTRAKERPERARVRGRNEDPNATPHSLSRPLHIASSVPDTTEAFDTRGESSDATLPELILRPGYRETALPGSFQTPRGVSSAAVASEIPGESVSAERLDLVLREQQADQRIASSRTQETRSVESSGGAQSGPNEFPPVESTPFTKRDARNDSPPSHQAQGRELQVEDISPRVIRSISERVIRDITLDLKFERERRGVTKWR